MATTRTRRTPASRPPAQVPQAPARPQLLVEDALDDAVARVRELSMRLWAVRATHRSQRSRLRGERCIACGQPYPCPTMVAAGPYSADTLTA